MTEADLAALKQQANDTHEHFVADFTVLGREVGHSWRVALAWAAVGVPLLWGIGVTMQKAVVLFR